GYVRAFDISATLSVEEVAGHSQIKVFPNPAKEYLTIRLGNEMELQKADMYNNVGQLVLSSGNSQEINVAGLSQGIYLLEIQTNQGKEIRKIIVQ
ncbi:MAG TPA: T9SS type A sorting domain-containing protein, partial [Mangrovimonas sp.]|nr:T9SS type A sorting domain-containing protein [Mangrovimonas sp.]